MFLSDIKKIVTSIQHTSFLGDVLQEENKENGLNELRRLHNFEFRAVESMFEKEVLFNCILIDKCTW